MYGRLGLSSIMILQGDHWQSSLNLIMVQINDLKNFCMSNAWMALYSCEDRVPHKVGRLYLVGLIKVGAPKQK